MKFTDYTCKELIGKRVILCIARRDGTGLRYIGRIERAERHHFELANTSMQFNYSGVQLLANDVRPVSIAVCHLVTDEEAAMLRAKWAAKKAKTVSAKERMAELEREMRDIKTLIQ